MKHSSKTGWNLLSKSYQTRTRISLDDVHYGPISAGERELRLLGDVAGKRILEIGCGGGQNAIVLAKWGAKSVGLDISDQQLAHAKALAAKIGVRVPFHLGDMQNLRRFPAASFDAVLSSHAIGYADNVGAVFGEVARILRPRGLFVFAEGHPIIRTGGPVRFRKGRRWAVGNYFDRRRRPWTWKTPDGRATFDGGQVTVQDFFDLLTHAGFTVERIVEPEPYRLDRMTAAQRARLPYSDPGYVKDYDLWRKVPFTIIFRARKTRLHAIARTSSQTGADLAGIAGDYVNGFR
jgi:SAM-dependent methyltransferase